MIETNNKKVTLTQTTHIPTKYNLPPPLLNKY